MKTSVNGFYPRVLLGAFTSLNADGLVPYVRNVVTLTTDNPPFANATPPLAVVTVQANALEAAAQAARDGGKILIAQRNAEQDKLEMLTRQLASFVQAHCNNDLATLLSSGFDAVKAPSPVGVLGAPQNPRLEITGISGQLLFRSDRLANSLNLTVQTATNPQGPWTDYTLSTTTRVLIVDRTPGTIYWVRACGNGSAGPGAWSNPATAMAV